jgi:hypothetical protein
MGQQSNTGTSTSLDRKERRVLPQPNLKGNQAHESFLGPAKVVAPVLSAAPATAVAGTVIILSACIDMSGVNETCSHLVEQISQRAADRMELPGLEPGCSWATLHLPTSSGRSWGIDARYGPSMAFPENLLCIQHAIVRGAVIDVNAPPPFMALQGKVYELHRSATETIDPLYLQLPLHPSISFMPKFQATLFLPKTHWVHEPSLDPTLRGDIARLAGVN